MTPQLAERRKNQRFQVEPSTLDMDREDRGTPALLKNISRAGLGCVCFRPIPEMTLVDLQVLLPALPGATVEGYPFTCKGAVVRCEPLTRGNSRRRWSVAVYFTEMDPENREILERYITGRS